MIQTDNTNGATVKQIMQREKEAKAAALKEKCILYANERFGEEQLKKWSNENKGLWFLPCMDEDEAIEKMALMRPITRHILSYATTKITDEGLYAFLEVAMRDCFVEGDKEILDDDEYFIPAANSFNKILEGKKAALVKR